MTTAEMFAATKARNEIALIPYLTAGYPSIEASLDLIGRAAGAGADAVELGLTHKPLRNGGALRRF